MILSKHGHAEVKVILSNGLLLNVNGIEYFLDFNTHLYFSNLPVEDIFNVKIYNKEHLRWEKPDIDLHTDILNSPEKYPLIMHPFTPSQMGKIGGRSTSRIKQIRSQENGRKGGRPKKEFVHVS